MCGRQRWVENVMRAHAKQLPAEEAFAGLDARADATDDVRPVEPLPLAQRPADDGALVPSDEVERGARVNEQLGRVPLLARPKLRSGAARRVRVVPAAPVLAERHQQNERRLRGRTLARHRQHPESVCVATGSSANGARLYGLRPMYAFHVPSA